MGGSSDSPMPMNTDFGSKVGVSRPVHPVNSPMPYVNLNPEFLNAVAPYLVDNNPFHGQPDWAALQKSIQANLKSTHEGLSTFAKNLPVFDRPIVNMDTGVDPMAAYHFGQNPGFMDALGHASQPSAYEDAKRNGFVQGAMDPTVNYMQLVLDHNNGTYTAPATGILGDGPITAVIPTAAGNTPYSPTGGAPTK